MRRQKSHPGFTLLEMSIVIVLVAALLGTVAVLFSSILKKYQYKETTAKLLTIQDALYEYRVAFNTMPCPADATMPVGHTHFGVQAQNPGSCTGGIPAVNFSATDASPQEARQGMVPTQTLHLPDDYAFDGWGHRIMYTVNKDLTQTGAFNLVNGYDPTQRMTINNEQGVPNTVLAAYVLVSYGPNGHGSFPRKGGAVRLSFGSVNADELNNCDCDAMATATGLNNVFVQKDASQNPANVLDSFDDLVVYGTRVDFILQSTMAWSLGPQYTFVPTGAGQSNGMGGGGNTNNPGGCFPAGTQIMTPRGDSPIETLLPGDEIIAVDKEGKSKIVKVQAFLAKRAPVLVLKTVEGTLHTTDEHPLLTASHNFRPAGELKVGDEVMVFKDDKETPSKILSLNHDNGEQIVYNLEVEEPHTFVADTFVVHNKPVWKVY